MPVICLRETDQASIRQLFLAGFESDGCPLPRGVLMALSRLIPCDAIGVGEFDSDGHLVSGTTLPVNAPAHLGPHVTEGPVPTGLDHVAALPLNNADALFNQAYGITDRLRIGFCVAGSRNLFQLYLERRHAMFSERDVAMLAMLQPALQRIVLDQRRSSPPLCLSGAESRVLELVAAGGSNQEVATSLCVSVATVRKHLEHVYRKLGVTNRTAAAAALADQRADATG